MHVWDDKAGHLTFRYKKYAYTKNRNGTYLSLYGDKLTRINKWDEDQPDLFESDVNPEIRVLVDNYTDSDDVSEGHRVMIFDIEVEVTDGFPDVAKAENKITSIAFNDPVLNKYYCYVLDPTDKLNLGKERTREDGDTIVSFYDEYDLLNAFYKKYMEIQPTILTGWNVEFFDVPYLYNRSQQVLGQEIANLLSPIQIVRWNSFKKRFIIAGVSTLDYLSLYKRFTFSQKTSYRLDAIGEDEVGEKKVSYEGTLNDLYENDLEKFVQYNIQDVKLVKKLDDKLDFIEIARGLAHLGHVPYESIYMSSHYLEGAILVYLKKNNIVAPNKPPRPETFNAEDKFTGAYVQDPQRGKHDWVYDLDITSMYPSCIMSLNISPETKLGKIQGWNPEEFLNKKNKKTYSITQGKNTLGVFTETELKNFLSNRDVSVATNGVMYRSDKDGLLPALLRKWFDERVEYRKLSKKFHEEGDKEKSDYFERRQYLQKVVLNSLYGVLGLSVFRFYDVDNAEAVTTTGQSLIKFTKKITNNYYNKELQDNLDYCIYIDTDSVFYSATPLVTKRFPNLDIKNEDKMSKAILEIASEVQSYLNKGYDYFAKKFCNLDKHRFDIKQEVIAKSGLFVTKKRYGLKIINDNGKKVDKMMVKGLDTVRSSFPIAMKEMLSKLLDDIMMDVPKDKLDKFILNFKKSMKLMDFEKIAIPTGMKGLEKYKDNTDVLFTGYKLGTPVHVKSAIFHNDLLRYYKMDKRYEKIINNEKIKWVYLKQNEFNLSVIAFKGYDDAPQIIDFIKRHINTEKIYEQVLHKKIMMLYEALGWDEPTDATKTIERFF